MKDKIREICTFHDKDGTSGYLLDEQRFAKIFEILDNQKKAILDKIENKKVIPGMFPLSEKSKIKNKVIEDIKSIINNLK